MNERYKKYPFTSAICYGIIALPPTSLILFFFSTMASDSGSTRTSQTLVAVAQIPLKLTINAAPQIPLKLTAANYFSWQAQFRALFSGLDLLGYLDGICSPPPPTISQDSDRFLEMSGPTNPSCHSCLSH